MKGIWITWESQRRNVGISTALGYPLYKIDIRSSRLFRYFKSICLTVKAIHEESPDVLIAQNPSIILASFIILYSKIGNYYSIIDAHNSGIYPLEGKSKILLLVARWIQRNADLTIVTNQNLQKHVEENGGNAFVLQDAMPTVPQLTDMPLEGTVNIACICTYSEDEPYLNIINSAKLIPDNIHIYITGNHKGRIDIESLPQNVHLTGFLSESDYLILLNSSDLIIDLTYREDCLVCGAYEAVALKKPLILSDTEALRDYFFKGCIYTDLTTTSIANSINKAVRETIVLQTEIEELKSELITNWDKKLSSLQEKLSLLTSNRCR